MKEPVLLIMAAGMGSRYGGLKQMDPIGPAGEVILHYSIYDAKRAGFKKVVFLIKHAIEEDFRHVVGDRAAAQMDVEYAYQELDMLPAQYTVPEGRSKPWGTGHAVLCCKECIGDAPFVAINSDDYYGPRAFEHAYRFLCTAEDKDPAEWMMVAYQLKNTTTANGHVARGVCSVDPAGCLTEITERTHIVESCDGPLFTEDGQTYHLLSPDTPVSMNLWGFTPNFFGFLEEGFQKFLAGETKVNPQKAEFYLPTAVNAALSAGKASVHVLSSEDKWYGVTYHQDRPVVVEALRRLTADGLYPCDVWK